MAFEDLITPEQVRAAMKAGDVPPRPPGPPTYGWTAGRKVVCLQGLTRSEWRKDPVQKVTASGWTFWYPTTAADFDEIFASEEVEQNKRRQTRRRPRNLLPECDVADDYFPKKNRHPWN